MQEIERVPMNRTHTRTSFVVFVLLALLLPTLAFATEQMPKWNSVSVSGYHIREAGATAGSQSLPAPVRGSAGRRPMPSPRPMPTTMKPIWLIML